MPNDTPESRFAALGLTLPPAPRPAANYVTFVRTGNLVYTSGHGPTRADGTLMTGRVGDSVDTAFGVEAARTTCLALLATLRTELGSLDKVVRIVKVLGMVNCVAEFGDQPTVINGCSDLLVAVFGDAGRHARSAVGMGSLPFNITVEIELVAEVAP
jgi:enamine deaminase RidA (YjgF/YER057c/UK114 family)